MKNNLTELVFILDRSGSMGGLEEDTIGGFNSLIEKQRKQEGNANVTTVLFDDQYALIHDRIPIASVSPMTREDYYVCGCTALLDAVGKTISTMDKTQVHLPADEKAEKVIFVITTDGLENASSAYSYDEVRRMIDRQKELGWEFLFLGATMDAAAQAQRLGISADRSVTYENDSQGIAAEYRSVGKALGCMRAMPCMSAMDNSWKEEIEEDSQNRKRKGRKKWPF